MRRWEGLKFGHYTRFGSRIQSSYKVKFGYLFSVIFIILGITLPRLHQKPTLCKFVYNSACYLLIRNNAEVRIIMHVRRLAKLKVRIRIIMRRYPNAKICIKIPLRVCKICNIMLILCILIPTHKLSVFICSQILK